MAYSSLKLTLIALELTIVDADYEDIAIHCYRQFLAIAEAMAGSPESGTPSLWDPERGFFMDLLETPDGAFRIPVYSWVGLIPLFAVEIVNRRMLAAAPRFARLLAKHQGGLFRGAAVCACPEWENERGERLLALADHRMLPRILARLLDEDQFLSRYGVRSLSRVHATDRDLGFLPGIGEALIEYVPGESNSPLFGGNSNWRGPIWLPTNYSLVSSLERYHRFLGDAFTVPVPCLGGAPRTLNQIATLIAERLCDLYRHADGGPVPALRDRYPNPRDPHWQDQFLFYEYFHAETGQGLGAAHQTGWTALLANLVMAPLPKGHPPLERPGSRRTGGVDRRVGVTAEKNATPLISLSTDSCPPRYLDPEPSPVWRRTPREPIYTDRADPIGCDGGPANQCAVHVPVVRPVSISHSLVRPSKVPNVLFVFIGSTKAIW
jgi:hypothetical protein